MSKEIESLVSRLNEAEENILHVKEELAKILKTSATIGGPKPREWRDRSMPLSIQCLNPGAMNFGKRAERYGSIFHYEGTEGNKTAIFGSWQEGFACLIDRIMRDKGKTMEDYLVGGDRIESDMSYTGGYNGGAYVSAFESHGLDMDSRISLSIVNSMVKCHFIMESAVSHSKYFDESGFVHLMGQAKDLFNESQRAL